MKKTKQECTGIKSKVGGQALIEGVMMRGPKRAAMAVRTPSNEIDIEEWDVKKPNLISKIPFARGIVTLFSSLAMGYGCLAKSAEKSGLEEENASEKPSKFESFIEDKFGDKIMAFVVILGVVLGVGLSILLFMFLPSLAVKGLDKLVTLGGYKALIEGFIKITIFVVYLALVGRMKDIRRVFEYHGAEHKSIFCLEAGEPLTVENVKKQSRFHPRCGTSFMILILIISILVFSLPIITWDNIFIRTGLKLLFLPLIVGIGYELIRLAGKHDNIITRIISFPGLKLQKLTTKEPDDSQIEVAIAALLPCIPESEMSKAQKEYIDAQAIIKAIEIAEALAKTEAEAQAKTEAIEQEDEKTDELAV